MIKKEQQIWNQQIEYKQLKHQTQRLPPIPYRLEKPKINLLVDN